MSNVEAIIQDLVGTSQAAPDWTAEEEHAVREQIFQCAMCDFWYSMYENEDDGVCRECCTRMRIGLEP